MSDYPICNGCGLQFLLTEGEKSFYEGKGLSAPKKCKNCRLKRKVEEKGAEGFHPARCSECNRDTYVPFVPKTGRELLCPDCFSAKKEEGDSPDRHE
jgi:CxxC-x17-CxxC domain-containing protein